jgi:hypothetical protein
MIVSYLAFLHGHIDYMVARLISAEKDERSRLIKDIHRVRNILNLEEEKEFITHNEMQNKE